MPPPRSSRLSLFDRPPERIGGRRVAPHRPRDARCGRLAPLPAFGTSPPNVESRETMHRASLASTRIETAIQHAIHEAGTARRCGTVSLPYQFTSRTGCATHKLTSSDDLSSYPKLYTITAHDSTGSGDTVPPACRKAPVPNYGRVPTRARHPAPASRRESGFVRAGTPPCLTQRADSSECTGSGSSDAQCRDACGSIHDVQRYRRQGGYLSASLRSVPESRRAVGPSWLRARQRGRASVGDRSTHASESPRCPSRCVHLSGSGRLRKRVPDATGDQRAGPDVGFHGDPRDVRGEVEVRHAREP